MLVLRRSVGEHILIAGNVRVTVLAIEGQRVKMGIEAPKEVPIVRSELVEGTRRDALAEQSPGKEATDD
jgi:carbon storage regulator